MKTFKAFVILLIQGKLKSFSSQKLIKSPFKNTSTCFFLLENIQSLKRSLLLSPLQGFSGIIVKRLMSSRYRDYTNNFNLNSKLSHFKANWSKLYSKLWLKNFSLINLLNPNVWKTKSPPSTTDCWTSLSHK